MFNWSLNHLVDLGTLWGYLMNVVSPFFLGLIMAFILNIPMRSIEHRLFAGDHSRRNRTASLLLTIFLLTALLFLFLFIVIPEIVQTIQVLIARLPGFVDRVTAWGQHLAATYPNVGVWISGLDLNWDSIKVNALDLLKRAAENILNSSFSVAASVFNGIVSFFLGLVFAVYILLQKETLARQSRKVLYAYLPQERVDRVIEVTSLAEKTFTNFITGQCLDATILGLMVFVAMLVFGFPYAVVIGVLVAITALIPVVGSFIACFIGAFLILVTSPIKAFWFVVIFLILQQLEGNFIYPRVVGNSVGLPAMWVLAAVVIGGNMMGVTGMLIAIPLCSILYVLLRESTNQRISKKSPLKDPPADQEKGN